MTFAGPDRNARLRQILRPYRAKADAFAVSLFAADCAMYAICTAAAAAHPSALVRFAAGIAAGVVMAMLFVVGHDPRLVPYADRVLHLADGQLADETTPASAPGEVPS